MCQETEGALWAKFILYGYVVAQRFSGDLCNRRDGSLDIATCVVWESAWQFVVNPKAGVSSI